MRLRRLFFAAAIAPMALGWGASSALGVETNCLVNASGGYANCLTASDPNWEEVGANHSSGLPYRFQLQRPATGSTWGWWEFNDQATHLIPLSLSGSITAQIDNRGSGNPSSYWIKYA